MEIVTIEAMASHELGAAPLTGAEIRERMAGNLCRCGAYNGNVSAVREVAGS